VAFAISPVGASTQRDTKRVVITTASSKKFGTSWSVG
jgi:hypothetical protein